METKELLDCERCRCEIEPLYGSLTHNGDFYHLVCYDEQFFACVLCDRIRDREDLIRWRGRECCDSCVDTCFNCDRVFDRDFGCEYCMEEDEEDEDNSDPDSIMDYACRAPDYLSFKGNPKDGMYFGVELEVEVKDGHGANEVAQNVRKAMPDFIITKYDGSLKRGFEIVTAPASLEAQYESWESFFAVKWPLLSFNTDSCGMHVHISRAALTPSVLGRMYVFLHEPENLVFVEQMAGRSLRKGNGNHYSPLCFVEGEKGMKLTDRVGIIGDKRKGATFNKKKVLRFKPVNFRGAINDQNEATIEFRIFKGTLAKFGFFKNLEFVRALTQFCKPGVVSLGDVGSKDKFKDFVHKNRKEYKYLDTFIKMKDAKAGKANNE